MFERPAIMKLVNGHPALLLAVALVVGACSGSAPAPVSGEPSPSASLPPASSPATAVTTPGAPASSPPAAPGPSESPEPPAPSATALAWPSGVPVLNPERCPDVLPADAHQTADGVQIDGDAGFIAHVEKALAVLKAKAADAYADVRTAVVMIRQVDAFSGMCYNNGAYRVGEETAHAPGYAEAAQVVWLAGTIVHDACHRARFVAGEAPSGKDAELACLKLQAAALRKIEKGTAFAKYVQGLIDGADDPANQYWTNANRHW